MKKPPTAIPIITPSDKSKRLSFFWDAGVVVVVGDGNGGVGAGKN